MLEGAAPARSAGVRHRGSAEPRNSRRGGWADGKNKGVCGVACRGALPRGQVLKAPEERLCSILPRQDGTCHGSERTPPGPPLIRAQREYVGWALGRKKEPRRGRSGIKEGLSRKYTSCFRGNRKNFRLCKNAHPGLWGDEGSTNLHREKKKNVLRT